MVIDYLTAAIYAYLTHRMSKGERDPVVEELEQIRKIMEKMK